jgi:regulator of replication initiation timing
MNISLKSASRGLTVVASLLCFGGVLSFVKSDERMKPLALNIIVTSGTVAIGSQMSGKWYEGVANSQLADITSKHANELKNLTSLRDEQRINYQKQSSVLAEVKAFLGKQDVEIKGRDAAINLLQDKLSVLTLEFQQKTQELDRKLAIEDTRFDDFKQEFKQQVISNLSEKLYQVFNSLSDSISFQLEKIKTELSSGEYSEKHDKLSVLFSSLDDYYQSHCNLLKDISDIDGSISEVVVEVIAIYSRMTDEQSALKVRYRNLLNVDERRALEDAYTTLADISKTHTPITKAKDLLGEYNVFQKNQLNNLGEQLEDNVNSLAEMRGQVFDLIAQIEQISLEKVKLKDELNKLNQPQTWRLATGSNELTKGNLIIQYFWSKGIKLDRAFTTGDVYESKIYYHTDNNPRTLIFKELNEHSEALQQLCLTLKPITFDWDADKGLMVATLAWKAREKEEKLDELSDKAIERLARSWDTWKKHAKKWNRIRITGGSGAGKSPLTERIVSEQLQHKKVKGLDAIKLFNPQAGSRKDNWSFPSTGKTHQDSIRGIAELTALCGRKYQGSFGIWMFDEVDSTLRQAPGKQRATKDDPEPEPTMSANMLSIITQIDHTSQAVFYLGQGANTGKIPNTTKGDWNNLVAIHINGNAKDYLRLADHIDTENKDKLMKQADLLQRYIDRKNSELGLDRVDPGAYRYALIDEYGEKQYYVLLPLFSADQFFDSLATPQVEPSTNLTTHVVSVPQIKCPHCESTKFHKHSAVKDAHKYRYSCLNVECKKTFIADALTNSN